MRALFVITLLATLLLPSGHAPASPPIDISPEELQAQAALGDVTAQSRLGLMYLNGQGVQQNYTKARQWYEKAAAQGDTKAQFALGVLYHDGQGVPQDYVQANMWYILAAASTGDQQKFVAEKRDIAERRMTPTQIAESQRLAQQCQARKFKGC